MPGPKLRRRLRHLVRQGAGRRPLDCDPIKHGNYAGHVAKHGGVLALCGDDPGAKSSSIAHQSEHALIHCGMPVLNPANVQEYLDLGPLGWALSRYSGCWVGFKCLTDTVDSARRSRSAPIACDRRNPATSSRPEGGLDHRVGEQHAADVEQRSTR